MKRPLSEEDFERGKKLDEKEFAIKDEVLYAGELFEGDIADNLLVNTSVSSGES